MKKIAWTLEMCAALVVALCLQKAAAQTLGPIGTLESDADGVHKPYKQAANEALAQASVGAFDSANKAGSNAVVVAPQTNQKDKKSTSAQTSLPNWLKQLKQPFLLSKKRAPKAEPSDETSGTASSAAQPGGYDDSNIEQKGSRGTKKSDTDTPKTSAGPSTRVEDDNDPGKGGGSNSGSSNDDGVY